MARDRQRAKQRKARRAGQNPGPSPSEPHRANVPGELEHVSGEVDEFDAALVAGAGGRPADDDGADVSPDEPFDQDELLADEGDDELLDDERDGRTATAGRRAEAPAAPRAERAGGPARLMAFLRASWAELQRVQWPDRRQVAQATAVVLGFVIIAGVYLGVADRVAQEVVNFII